MQGCTFERFRDVPFMNSREAVVMQPWCAVEMAESHVYKRAADEKSWLGSPE